MKTLDKNNLPRHIAIIMDGNGRWAEKRSLGRIQGHRKGVQTVKDIARFCREIGIEYLTLYTFSTENWHRPKVEVNALMELLKNHLKTELNKMMKDNIRFRAIGNIDALPKSVQRVIHDIEEQTSNNSKMNLNLALSYSGRQEIIEAARKLAGNVAEGKIAPQDITEEVFSQNLYTCDIPDPDLLIRTSGEIRISNFLLWQVAYAEIYVTEVLWPDFTPGHLLKALQDYQKRERRFGLTREQIRLKLAQ
ncbi:MAG: isoprenyl transferase [Deltaproteobacteria bacterium]|nr:isoprenyl transferase [Deltaproteobacteria bacterium]